MTARSQNIMLYLIYFNVEITAHFENTFSDSLSNLRITAHSQNKMLSLIYLHIEITAQNKI